MRPGAHPYPPGQRRRQIGREPGIVVDDARIEIVEIVEGQENPLALISTAKLYEVQKYCSLTNHMWDGYWFLANRRAWERLPEDVRTIVAKNINGAGMKAREDTEKLNANLQTELAAKGFTFNQPDLKPFREKLRQAGFYAEWKGKYGDEAWAILEKNAGKLT